MKRIYTNEVFPASANILLELEKAGIDLELHINASEYKFPYFTFSEFCLAEDEDYSRAVRLILDK